MERNGEGRKEGGRVERNGEGTREGGREKENINTDEAVLALFFLLFSIIMNEVTCIMNL